MNEILLHAMGVHLPARPRETKLPKHVGVLGRLSSANRANVEDQIARRLDSLRDARWLIGTPEQVNDGGEKSETTAS
jgi:hypothetical protein